MKSFTSSLLFAAAATALPNSVTLLRSTGGLIIPRQNQLIPVVVGGPQDTFAPNSMTAAVGDVVQFQFSNGNHTATQSTLEAPCTALEGGMHSGHIPFQDGQTDVGTFNMPITSADPMFIFCATGPHCQEGQVMVINPTSAQQVVDFVKAAQGTAESVDGSAAVGGTAGKIALDAAGFVPAKPEDPAAAPPAAPPAEAPPAEAPPAESAPATTAPAATEAPASSSAPPAEAPPAETTAAAAPAA